MKRLFFVFVAITLCACASGPRAYDGVVGYRTEPVETGLEVTYADEADTSDEQILSYIFEVCAETLKVPQNSMMIQVTSVSEVERRTDMSLQIPVGTQPVTSLMHGMPVESQQLITQQQTVFRNMKLKEMVAVCSTAG